MKKQKICRWLIVVISNCCFIYTLLFLSGNILAMNIQNTYIAKGKEAFDTQKSLNTLDNLQATINAATDGDTIVLAGNTTYIGDINIDKPLTLTGNGTQRIAGKITYEAPFSIENTILEQGISGTASLTLQECTVSSGGIKIIDNNGTNNVTILKSTLYYDDSTTAIAISGLPDSSKYFIGNTLGANGSPLPSPNTFVNDGDKSASVISWPAGSQQLYAGKNYWKIKNKDALYHEIKVTGNVRYYERINIPAIRVPRNFKFIPPKGAAFEKGGVTIAGKFDPNTAKEYIQTGDYWNFLYNRSFLSAGLPIIEFHEFIIDSIPDISGNLTKLPKEYLVKCKSAIFKDNNFGIAFPSADIENKIWHDGTNFYLGIWDLMLPMKVIPQSMVSYAGTTDELDDVFPRVYYDFVTPNTLWFPNQPSTGSEFYNFQQQSVVNHGINSPILMGFLKDKGLYYAPWFNPDPALDLDGDFLPFQEKFLENDVPASVSQSGQYSIDIANKDNISRIGYNETLAEMNGIKWKKPWISLGYVNSTSSNPVDFYSEFQPGKLIVRPTSGDLSVEPVVDIMHMPGSTPIAIIDNGTIYKDSTGKILEATKVSLLNDNIEPTETIAKKMLAIASSNSATQGKTYQHHYLSLLNVLDGNNVVTTNSSKTVYIPYPSDYKKGSALTLLHFEGYNRMPNETVDSKKTTVISDAEIKKLDDGFTFTTTGNLGSYILAYEKKASPITPIDPPANPELPVKPEPPLKPEAPIKPNPPVMPESPIKPETPVTSESPIKPKPTVLPQTSDTGTFPWTISTICSGIIFMFVYNRRRKKINYR